MILILTLKNVVGELSQKMLLNCSEIYVFELFSLYILLISPSHTVMAKGLFGPALGILTWIVSA